MVLFDEKLRDLFTELFYFYRNSRIMKCFFLPVFVMLFFFSCGKKETFKSRDFNKVEIEPLIEKSNFGIKSVRAIEISNNRIWFAGSDGNTGNHDLLDYDKSLTESIIFKELEEITHSRQGVLFRQMNSDTTGYELRAISKINDKYFVLTAGNPAILTKYDSIGHKIVYTETHPKAFYDSMEFWNDEEGIAIGDSTDGCLSVIITRDGGETWNKLSCDDLPKGIENEGAFAASDTNIAIIGDNTWVATTAGRVYYSPDKGKTWEVYNTPIVKGKETEGIYSIDFYDALNGFAIGGDYTKPGINAANKMRTIDGGKTWELVAQNQNPGYRSCVQYIPNSKGKELVAIGFKGIDYSNDSGSTWKHLSDEGFYTIRFLNDSIAYAAGAGRISKLTFRE